MPILGSSNSAANKTYDVKKYGQMGYNYQSDYVENIVGKEEIACYVKFPFFYNVFKSCLSLMHQNEYSWSKGLTKASFISISRIHARPDTTKIPVN